MIPFTPQEKKDLPAATAARLADYGQKHLSPELTGFVLTLWTRIGRLLQPDFRHTGPNVWAAATVHVIAKMNFCYDPGEPVSITLGGLCNHFAAPKNTVGRLAAEIGTRLHLSQAESDLCLAPVLAYLQAVPPAPGP